MIELRSKKARTHVLENKKAIKKGLECLVEAVVLEAEAEVGELLPTRIADRYAAGRVRRQLQPRVDTFFEWVESLGE